MPLYKIAGHAILSLTLWTAINLCPYQALSDIHPWLAAAAYLIGAQVVMQAITYDYSAWTIVLLGLQADPRFHLHSPPAHLAGFVFSGLQTVPCAIAIAIWGFPFPFACLIPAVLWTALTGVGVALFIVPRQIWNNLNGRWTTGWRRQLCRFYAACSQAPPLSSSSPSSPAATASSSSEAHLQRTRPVHIMRIQLLMAISVAAWVVANAFFALFIILNDYPIAQVTAIILFRGLLGTLRQYRSGIISHRMRFARPLDTASQFRVQNASYLDFEMLGFVFINLSMPSIGSWYAAALFIASDMAGLLSNLVYFFATSGRYLRRDTQEFMDRQVFRSHSSTAAAGSTATGSGVTAIEEREQRVPLMPSRRSSTKPPLPAPPPPPPPLFSVSEKLVLGSIRTTTSSVCSSTLHPESEGGHSVSHVALSPSSNQHLTASGRMDGSELRATEQMRLSDRSPVPTTLDLCIQTFILDLLVRFFSIAYFFTYVVPVTQIESQLYWNPTIRFVYDNRTDKSDPAVTTLPIHRAVVYMGTTLALSFVCALIVDFLARTLTRRSLMEHAREMLGHADMYLITVGSLYLAPVFMIGGRHWGFLAYLFDLAVGSEIGHVP